LCGILEEVAIDGCEVAVQKRFWACGNRFKKLPGTDGAGFEKNKDFNLIAEDILKVKEVVKSVCK